MFKSPLEQVRVNLGTYPRVHIRTTAPISPGKCWANTHFIFLSLTRQQQQKRVSSKVERRHTRLCCRRAQAEGCERGSGGHQGWDDRTVPGYDQKWKPLRISEFFFNILHQAVTGSLVIQKQFSFSHILVKVLKRWKITVPDSDNLKMQFLNH